MTSDALKLSEKYQWPCIIFFCYHMHLTSKIQKNALLFCATSVTPLLLHVLQQTGISESLEAWISRPGLSRLSISDASFCRDWLGKHDCNISEGKLFSRLLGNNLSYVFSFLRWCCWVFFQAQSHWTYCSDHLAPPLVLRRQANFFVVVELENVQRNAANKGY